LVFVAQHSEPAQPSLKNATTVAPNKNMGGSWFSSALPVFHVNKGCTAFSGSFFLKTG